MGDSILREWVKKLVKKQLNNGDDMYCLIKKITEHILTQYYNSKGKNIEFPIDIRSIIESHGIDILEMDLNVDLGFRIDRVNGYLSSNITPTGQKKWRIFVEYSDSEFTKRYVLAHEFSHFVLKTMGENYDEHLNETDHCIDPMIPKDISEIIADIMAAYFMIPPWLLLEEMRTYTELMEQQNLYPIDAVQLMRNIGNRAQISSYHTFICFQYLKYYLCILYNDPSQRSSEDNKLIDKYKFLFR